MTGSLFSQWFGWAGFILLIIPLVLLVRLLVKESRWSILRMTIVSVIGVVIVSLWLHFAEDVTGAAPLSMSGKLGLWLSEKLQVWTGNVKISFFISSGLILLWIIAAGMDAIIASARFFINKPYIREIVKEKIVEVEKPVAPKVRKELKPQKQPVKRPAEPKPVVAKGDDDVPDFKTPTVSLLKDRSAERRNVPKSEIDRNIAIIRETLANHNVQVKDIEAVPGPTVTLYKVYPAKNAKVAALCNLKEPDCLDFQDHCFITEFSDVPMEKSNPSHMTEASVVSRINTLFKEAFFQSFPIVVISSRAYVKLYNIDLECLFPNAKVIVANLLSRTPSAKYLEGIVAKMKGENNYCYPYKELNFTDPYGRTSLSPVKTLLFCAYFQFVIPHDVVGVILYSSVLAGSSKASFGHDTQFVIDLSPSCCVESVDWCLSAIKSMGYPDIVEEFEHLDDEMIRFLEENYYDKPWDIDNIRKKIESIVPQQYMTIIKKNQ